MQRIFDAIAAFFSRIGAAISRLLRGGGHGEE
jgi:hypothetical protein